MKQTPIKHLFLHCNLQRVIMGRVNPIRSTNYVIYYGR
jgi:hypothetical protein